MTKSITLMFYLTCHKCGKIFHGEQKEYHWIEFPIECPDCEIQLMPEVKQQKKGDKICHL